MNHILIILAFNLIAYFRTLKNFIILDDIPWYEHRNKEKIKVGGIRSFVNWFRDTLYGGATFGINVELDHLFAIGLNCLTSVLIYIAFGSNNISFWASMLWIANPINNQVTIWLNGRRFIINIIFVLLMMILPYGLFLYPFTCILQVSAIFSPVLLAGKHPLTLLAIPLLFGFAWPKIKHTLGQRYDIVHDADRRVFTPKRLFIIIKQYGHYFFKMLIPGVCASIYPLMHYWGITEKGNKDAYSFNRYFWRGILALGFILLLLCLCGKDHRIYSIFMGLAILQWCAIIPVNQDMADRYASLPNVFMMFFLSYFVNTYLGPYALPVMIGIMVYYTAMLFEVMKMYPNMNAYWEHARYHFPQIPSPRKYEIEHYLRTDVNHAWVLCKDGLRHNKDEFAYLQQAAVCHKIISDYPTARRFAEEAMKNYYLGQKHVFEPKFKMFLDNLVPSGTVLGQKSRQVKRAEERNKK